MDPFCIAYSAYAFHAPVNSTFQKGFFQIMHMCKPKKTRKLMDPIEILPIIHKCGACWNIYLMKIESLFKYCINHLWI
jgi:hypothetical protein